MRSKGPAREDVQCLDAGKYAPSFTWKCSAAWCGSAVPESLPVPNSLGKPRLGSSGNGWTPVSRRAVSGGKRKDHIAGEVGASIRKRKAGSKMSDSWGKKAPGLERSRGNTAALHHPPLEGGGLRCHLVGASAGRGPKPGLNASGRSHLLETQSLFRTQPHPKPAPLQGLRPKLLPACASREGFQGKIRAQVQSPQRPHAVLGAAG